MINVNGHEYEVHGAVGTTRGPGDVLGTIKKVKTVANEVGGLRKLMALVEALIAGRPAVVTDVGDSAQWAIDGETGLVAEAATAASIGRALSRAWERRSEFGSRTISVSDRSRKSRGYFSAFLAR